MAKTCIRCGTVMNDADTICRACGQPAVTPPYQGQIQSPQHKKRKLMTLSNIIIIVLCVMLLINGTIAGIWYPGFFTVHTVTNGGNNDSSLADGNEGRTDNGGKNNEADTDSISYEDDIRIGKTSDISVSYSDEELSSAPRTQASVSPDSPTADCGDIHVDFSYNLQGEDTFVVTRLPDKTDENSGLRVKAYDFSLASGQREFATDVVVTVPRDEDDNDTTYWATFNEETGKWERIYSKLSDDGKSYLVYTNHFCKDAKISVAQQLYEKLFGALKGNKDEARKAAKNLRGLFYYADEINDSTKDQYVFMFDPQTFEEYMDEACVSTLDELDEIIQKTPKDRYAYVSPMKSLFGFNEEPKVGIAEADVTTAIGGFVEAGADQLVNVGQLGGKAGQAAAVAGKVGGFAAKGATVIGPVAFIWSGLTLGSKLTTEVTQGKTTMQALGNHKIDTLSFVISGIGMLAGAASAPYLAAGCAIAGVGLYAASLMNDSKRDLSVNERVYREYYTPEYGSARRFYYISVPSDADPKKKTGIIPKIKGLDSEQDAVLQKIINRYGGLTGYNTLGIAADAETYKNNPINMEWALALSALYYVNEKQPDKITESVKLFYENYANACFSDGWTTYNNLDKEYRKRKGYDDKFVMKTKESDRTNFITNYTNEMMRAHAPLIKDINETFAHKAKAGLAELVSDDLLELMNTRMEIRVIDEAVGDSRKDFFRSVYAVDYKTIPGNQNAAVNGIKDYKLPMSFESLTGPIILPGIKTDEGYRSSTTDDYLTYTDNLIPRYQANRDNVVFSCRFYHYLLLGIPDVMIFHNVKDEEANDIRVPIELKEPDKDGVIRITLNVKGQSQTDTTTHSLKIYNSPLDWDYSDNTNATVTIDNKLNVQVSIPKGEKNETSGYTSTNSKCSSFTIKAKAQKYAREYFDTDGSWECYAKVKDLKLTRTYNSYKKGELEYSAKHVFTFNGTVTLKCENSHGVVEVVVELPEYTDEKTEVEYYHSGYGPKEEVKKSHYKGFNMKWTLNNG